MSGTLTIGDLILTTSTANNDAFDRLRVSEPETIFDLTHTSGKMNYMIDEFVSATGATSNHISNNSYVQMALTDAGVTGKVIRQSYEYVIYQPGKSKLMLFSGVMEALAGGITGVVSRIGCFDSSEDKTFVSGHGNGCFFELNNKTLYAVIRNNNDDSSKVAQSAWNFDRFDGTGPSGITVNDFSKCLLFGIDQEWLGVGRVRFGFYFNGQFMLGHMFNHSGLGSPTSTALNAPYVKTAKLPVRYEISSTTSNLAEMRMLCSTILSEGGYEPASHGYSIGNNLLQSISSTTTAIPIIALKLRELEPYNRKTAVLKNINILNTTSNSMQLDLYLLKNSTYITGGTWTQSNTSNNSIVEYNNTPTTLDITGGILIDSYYVSINGNLSLNYDKYLEGPKLNSSIDGHSKVFCIAGVSLGGTVTVAGSFSWSEFI
jgi:hypothetical protein